MSEYKIKGTIITEQISTRNIEAGTVCLVNKNGKFHRITITHIDKEGNWIVEGDYNGSISKERNLFRLSILTPAQCIAISFADWKNIINNNLIGSENQEFIVKSHKFKEGNNIQTCSECTASFVASKSQPYCKRCCEKFSIAYLTKDKKFIEKMFKKEFVINLAMESYIHGQKEIRPSEFKKWLNKELENGNNIN
jgi:hypothetical protein